MADTLSPEIVRVGVVGAGRLGMALADLLSRAGFEVLLVERERRAMNAASGLLRHPAIRTSSALSDLRECDLVIEAATEDYDAKASIFIGLDQLLPGDRIIATTTSGVDIDALAAVTRRASRVCGMHVIPSAQAPRVVEIVRTSDSSPGTLATAVGLARHIGLLPVVVGNAFGFIGPRLQAAAKGACLQMAQAGQSPAGVRAALLAFGFSETFVEAVVPEEGSNDQAAGTAQVVDRLMVFLANEAACLLEDGVATASSDIDVLMVDAYGFPPWEGGPAFWASERGLCAVMEARNRYMENLPRYRRGRLELLLASP